MIMRWFPLLLMLLVSCTEPPDDDDPPIPPAEPCEPAFTNDFVMGIVIFDNPRWFRAFDEGCNTVEMETGLQGGWHTEPAIQAPRDAVNADLGGRILWTVTDESGGIVAEAEFELFRSFWQTLEGGDAYWGDFVIFDRDPNELVGSKLTIECELDFDDKSNLEDLVVTNTVEFVDEDPTTVFE